MTPLDPGFYPAAREVGHRDGHRPAAQGRRRQGHPGPADRRRTGRARGRVGVRRYARPRRKLVQRLVKRYESAVAARKDADEIVGVDASDRPSGLRAGAPRLRREQHRRERLLDDAADRPGQGRARRRLHRAAVPQRRQGRVLRQARRRDGRCRASSSPSGASASRRSAETRPPGCDSRTSTPSSTTTTCRSSSAR